MWSQPRAPLAPGAVDPGWPCKRFHWGKGAEGPGSCQPIAATLLAARWGCPVPAGRPGKPMQGDISVPPHFFLCLLSSSVSTSLGLKTDHEHVFPCFLFMAPQRVLTSSARHLHTPEIESFVECLPEVVGDLKGMISVLSSGWGRGDPA